MQGKCLCALGEFSTMPVTTALERFPAEFPDERGEGGMSDVRVRVTIDGRDLSVPKGTLIVDAAKKLGIDIPVFCYHPKMKPVGMCRMCLVEVGRPQRRPRHRTAWCAIDAGSAGDRSSSRKLETACTTPVEDGWCDHG